MQHHFLQLIDWQLQFFQVVSIISPENNKIYLKLHIPEGFPSANGLALDGTLIP
jgi:hypothetical protein